MLKVKVLQCMYMLRFTELASDKLGEVSDAGWWSGGVLMRESQSYTRTFGAAASLSSTWDYFLAGARGHRVRSGVYVSYTRG